MGSYPRFVMLSIFWSIGLTTGCGSNSTEKKPTTAPTAQTGTPATGTATPAGNTQPAGGTPQTGATATSTGGSATSGTTGDAVVIADSIGRGLFALHNYGAPISDSEAQSLLSILGTGNTTSAIWSALETSSFVAPQFSAYAGTGGAEQPTFRSLLNLLGTTGNIHDSSIIGSTISNTDSQLAAITAKMQSEDPSKVKKAVFALGNNDYCGGTGGQTAAAFIQTFSVNYLAQIRKVAASFPQADLYFIAPVNQIQLKKITQDGSIQFASPLFTMLMNQLPHTCPDLQKIYCPELFAPDAATHMANLQQAVHTAVISLAGELAGKGTRAVYFSDVNNVAFTTDMVAADCFHPNIKGQMTLAQEAFHRAQKVVATGLVASLEASHD